MKKLIEITEEGKKYLERGLPEKNLIDILKAGPIDFGQAKKKIENFDIALQWAKKNGWVEVKEGKLVLTKYPEFVAEQDALKKLADSRADEVDDVLLEKLVWRKLVRVEGKAVRAAKKLVEKEVADLTPELIKTGFWKQAKFKPYNVRAIGKKIHPGKLHILTVFEQKVRRIYLDLGFTEADGPFVESNFWNFDALFQPQDHPARDLADTFYMKTPAKAKLPTKFINAVKATHESGWKTGSLGWKYKWSEEFSKKNVMRTHTTSVSVRELSKLTPPAKRFCIGRVYRNETIDYKHLPEFVQVDGIVVDENVRFKDLLGYLKEFYLRLGFKKIRFTPSFFPYTEMSTQIEVFFEDKKEWLELGGSGIFRPEVTEPLGIKEPVLAWGLGFERPIILRLGLKDIRNFYYRNDLKMLREVKLWQ
jgi:phenylalanyl-tRNA synthetase alpha chain